MGAFLISVTPDIFGFPSTRVALGLSGHVEVALLTRECRGDAAAIRRIFKAASKQVGLHYFDPHSFRNTLMALGVRLCRIPKEFKAWSQKSNGAGYLGGKHRPHFIAIILAPWSVFVQILSPFGDGGHLVDRQAKPYGAGYLYQVHSAGYQARRLG